MDLLLVILVGVVAVAVVTTLAQRLGVAGPLLLVALGLAIGLVPFIDVPEIDPEWILVGVLPPLLYAAAVRLPAIEFRRDFTPIAGLAVVLVVVTSLVLGLFFSLLLPGVGFALGIALGAILSPTDAVATGIAKRLGIAPRVVTMLEGESLLNDATALVLLRTALLAVAAGVFSFGSAVGAFAWAVFIAVTIGAVIGWLAMRLRSWVRNSPASTAIGFTVPFVAYLPVEHLNGSGLVAAVVAGLVAGQGAQRWFTPEQRLSDSAPTARGWRASMRASIRSRRRGGRSARHPADACARRRARSRPSAGSPRCGGACRGPSPTWTTTSRRRSAGSTAPSSCGRGCAGSSRSRPRRPSRGRSNRVPSSSTSPSSSHWSVSCCRASRSRGSCASCD